VALDVIQRLVGFPEKAISGRLGQIESRHAGAERQGCRARARGSEHALRIPGGRVEADRGQQQCELVAADPSDDV
jgi:hypothetical protein